jgi:hypothetical protein
MSYLFQTASISLIVVGFLIFVFERDYYTFRIRFQDLFFAALILFMWAFDSMPVEKQVTQEYSEQSK